MKLLPKISQVNLAKLLYLIPVVIFLGACGLMNLAPVIPPSTTTAYVSLKVLQAKTESRISYASYCMELGEVKHAIQAFRESPEANKFPGLARLLNKAMTDFELAEEVWSAAIMFCNNNEGNCIGLERFSRQLAKSRWTRGEVHNVVSVGDHAGMYAYQKECCLENYTLIICEFWRHAYSQLYLAESILSGMTMEEIKNSSN